MNRIVFCILIDIVITFGFIIYAKNLFSVYDNTFMIIHCYREIFSPEGKKHILHNLKSEERIKLLSIIVNDFSLPLFIYKSLKKKLHLILIFDILLFVISNTILFYT